MASSTPATRDGTFAGSCLCGQIRYVFEIGTSSEGCPTINHCHCSDCRKFHGAAFGTAVKAVTWEWEYVKQGPWVPPSEELPLLQSYKQPNGCQRYFCRVCGSSLAFQSAHPNDSVLYFAISTLDGNGFTANDDSPNERQKDSSQLLQPSAHIFWDSKADWLISNEFDSLPKYSKDRTSCRRS